MLKNFILFALLGFKPSIFTSLIFQDFFYSLWSSNARFVIPSLQGRGYRKNLKISDTRKIAIITLKVEQNGFSLE